MRMRTLIILGVLGTSLLLRADSCLIEQVEVDVVLGTEIPAEWVSVGFTDATGVRKDTLDVNPTDDLVAELDDLDLPGDLVSIQITGVGFKVLTSEGHDARRFGIISVEGFPFIEFNTPTNAAGTTAFAKASGTAIDPLTSTPELRLRSQGLSLLNDRLDTFLQQYLAGGSPDPTLLELSYVADWTSTPAPTAGSPDNFTWTTNLQVQIIQKSDLDTFDP